DLDATDDGLRRGRRHGLRREDLLVRRPHAGQQGQSHRPQVHVYGVQPMKRSLSLASARLRGSRGVTLVQLMVAVTIGLLIIVVVAQLFLGSKQTFATTDDVSRMQDNIRYTQQLLTRIIHQAGYKSQANSVTTTVFSGNPPLQTPNPIPTGTTPDWITVR